MDADERKPAETPVGFAAAAVSFDDPEVQVEGAFLGCQEHIVRKTTRMKARQASPALPCLLAGILVEWAPRFPRSSWILWRWIRLEFQLSLE